MNQRRQNQPNSLLDEYRNRRDPERTSEPFGGIRLGGSRLFVVQKHAARSLHYDLRLEIEGVLKSWAISKGPSGRAEEKRLAVQVEDHPIEYADFEGVIPAGNYGAGPIIVWDRGWYRSDGDDPVERLAQGKLEVEFFGFKLRGRWMLIKLSGKEREWLLFKKADAYSFEEELTERYPQSILSGLTVEELRDASTKLSALHSQLDSVKAEQGVVLPRRQQFMLASTGERPFSSKEWLFEFKYDGVRVLASRSGKDVELYGRRGQSTTTRYPEVARALRALPVEQFVLDGEIVALDESGRPSFQRLQKRMHLTNTFDIERARTTVPVSGIFFDCLALEGRDLRSLPLVERKECLKLLIPARGVVHYCDHILEHGEALFEVSSEQRLEGVIAKRVDSRYVVGRSKAWIKLKCQRRQEFVIGGYTQPKGSRGYFGSLHLGLYEGGRLVYVSKVGTGFNQKILKSLWTKFESISRDTSPFEVRNPTGRDNRWLEPVLVCEVSFTEWTRDGGIRHPTFLGLRDDKQPKDCWREQPMKIQALPPSPERSKFTITNPSKVFWPAEGYTKSDLIAYYESIAPLLLPYLKERPLVLTRYPDGIEGKSFFQKDAPEFVPAWVKTERIYSKDSDREIDYFIVNDLDTLRYVSNLGTIPLHLWSSRLSSLDRPDWLILDLDPKGAPMSDVVKVARTLHHILEELELPNYVKTSGATGLHVVVPLGARYSHEEARTYGRLLALLGMELEPNLATIARPLHTRGGKVYIDFVQNGHGRTVVAPFSIRPLPCAPVSCPLSWSEVTARLDPTRFTIKTALRRFERRGDPLAPVLGGAIDMAATLPRIEHWLRTSGKNKQKPKRR